MTAQRELVLRQLGTIRSGVCSYTVYRMTINGSLGDSRSWRWTASWRSRGQDVYLVIGDCVGILLNERTLTEPDNEFVWQSWLRGRLPFEERVGMFANWLKGLEPAPELSAATPAQAWQSLWNAFSPVAPIVPLPPPASSSRFDLRTSTLFHHHLSGNDYLPLGSVSHQQAHRPDHESSHNCS